MVYPTRAEEERYISRLLENDKEYNKRLEQLYIEAQRDIQDRIELFISRNVTEEELNIAEALLPADMDERYQLFQEVESPALDYLSNDVKRDIIYNIQNPTLTRLQLLDSHIYLNVGKLESKHNNLLEEYLTNIFTQEYLRQHENIGFTATAEQYGNLAKTIVHQSFNGAQWDQRLSAHSGQLRRDMSKHVERSLLSGKNPQQGVKELAEEIEKTYTGRKSLSALEQSKMLAITEAGRIQTETQKYSYDKYGIEEYEFIGELDACKECQEFIGKTFKTGDLSAGLNACPLHPRCRCSTVPKIDRAEWENRMAQRGL